MENAAEALKMAGAVLIFVLAISITILSFGQVRETADIILDYKDRETFYIDGDYYYKTTGTERSVGLESVIPTVFRAYLENYKIVFEGLESPIYKIKASVKNESGIIETKIIDKYSLDLETNLNTDYQNVVLANDEQKSEFLCGILYGKFKTTEEDFENKFNVILGSETKDIYSQITSLQKKGKGIKEYLGVYYQNDSKDEPDVNKTEKRIITYKIQ